jgi:hypothetical protein
LGWLQSADLPRAPASEVPGHRPPWVPLGHTARGDSSEDTGPTLRKLSERALPPHLLARLTTMRLADASYPWNTIGRVFVGTAPDYTNPNESGTGALVGHNLLLTASHLIPWDSDPSTRWIRFVPGYVDGNEPSGHSYVSDAYGVRGPTHPTGLDYVICRLSTPLGDGLGWMGSHSFGSDDEYRGWFWDSVGYPGTFHDAQEPDVKTLVAVDSVSDDGDGVKLYTAPFTDPGWSGGPLFGYPIENSTPRVVGVCSGFEEVTLFGVVLSDNSVFAGGYHMVNLVKYGLTNWP